MAANIGNPNITVYLPLVIAFGVVVCTAIANALLEGHKARLLAKRNATAVRRALLAEIRVHLASAASNQERSEAPYEGGSFVVPITERFPVFETVLPTIGLLTPSQVEAVVNFYAVAAARVETLCLIGRLHRIEGAVLICTVDATYAEVLVSQAEYLYRAAKAAADSLEDA